MAKKTYDWVAIESAYRTGRYSFRQLSDLYGPAPGTISGRQSKEGWTKDLDKAVRDKTRDILTAGEQSEGGERQSDAEIVAAAAATAAHIVTQHRNYAARGRTIVGLMMDKLEAQINRGNITVDTNNGPMTIDIPLDYMGKSVNNMTAALERLVKIERQAFNMDVKDDAPAESKLTDEQLDERIKRLSSVAPE